MLKSAVRFVLMVALLYNANEAYAQPDTIRVMAYNVLNYGSFSNCQGPLAQYHAYFDTIAQFASADIIGLEKIASIQTSPTDHNNNAPIGFQDSILSDALNVAFPGRYNYCPNTNFPGSNTECLMFYNQQKLGYSGIVCTYSNTEDFNTYKFYYLDPNLSTTHDTTFLYVTDNHDISGDGNEAERGAQVTGEIAKIKNHFTHLANMINMGDFNLRNTSEPVYDTLTSPSDTNFRYYDPPFHPDGLLSYPADWDSNPVSYAPYLTTSTRVSGSYPNSCGTSGGGKDWYDHIFLSPWIVNNSNYIAYRPNSFRVIGNDGHRVGISINNYPANTAAPTSVINSLFQMSNKYPIMVDLLVTPFTPGSIRPPSPEIIPSAVSRPMRDNHTVAVANPVSSQLILRCSEDLKGQQITVDCYDIVGRMRTTQTVQVDNDEVLLPCNLDAGMYLLRISGGGEIFRQQMIVKY